MYIPEAAIHFCKVSGIDHTHSVNQSSTLTCTTIIFISNVMVKCNTPVTAVWLRHLYQCHIQFNQHSNHGILSGIFCFINCFLITAVEQFICGISLYTYGNGQSQVFSGVCGGDLCQYIYMICAYLHQYTSYILNVVSLIIQVDLGESHERSCHGSFYTEHQI